MWVRLEAKLLKSLGAIFYTVEDDIVLDFTTFGMRFKRVDPAHVYLADVTVMPSAFNRYDRSLTEQVRIVIDADDLKSFLKPVKDVELVTINVTDDGHVVLSTDKIERTMNYIDSTGYDSPHVPTLSAKAIFRIHVADFRTAVRLVDDVAEHIYIEVTSKLIRMYANDFRGGKVEYKIPNKSISLSKDLDTVSSLYSIEYLQLILKSIPSEVRDVKVYMDTNYPIRIEYKFGNFTKKDTVLVCSMMAPRLDNDNKPSRKQGPGDYTPGNPIIKPESSPRDNVWRS